MNEELFRALNEDIFVLFNFWIIRGSILLVLLFKADNKEPGRAFVMGPVDCCDWLESAAAVWDCRSPMGSLSSDATANASGSASGLPLTGT
jgi:hypothetical protein